MYLVSLAKEVTSESLVVFVCLVFFIISQQIYTLGGVTNLVSSIRKESRLHTMMPNKAQRKKQNNEGIQQDFVFS